MHQDGAFGEIALILGLACLLGVIGQKIRQPLLIMFLAAGILAGPAGWGIIASHDQINLLAEIGIALLLFIVGLKLDLKLIRTTGPVALATGLGQIIFTSAIGFGVALLLGMELISAAYVAVALTFSSTIIIVKLLSDKKEIDSLHGQIAIGFLIVQDIAAVLALVGLTTFGATMTEGGSPVLITLGIIAKGIGMLTAVGLLMRFVLPWVVRRLAASQELLILFAITWAVLLGAGGEWLGFSKEVGAFLAGISLASTDYRDAIGGRLATLRDFLLLFFFINLGARLDWSMVGAQWGNALLLSAFVLIGNPLIVLAIMGAMGYRRRTSFLAGLTVAQISEFSLIVTALGLGLDHIGPDTMGLVTLVGVVTILASTYMILYSDQLYRLLSTPLRFFERREPSREGIGRPLGDAPPVDAILMGLGTYGGSLADYLLSRDKTLIGVDFDPAALEHWQSRGVEVLYGDMADPDIHEQLPLHRARWVVSTLRSETVSIALLRLLKQRGFTGRIALTAADREQAAAYEKAGAHLVLRPFIDAAEQAADALSYAFDFLPRQVDWPIAFQEVRIRSDSATAGMTIRDLPLPRAGGVSILALSRAGRVVDEIHPDDRIHPGDQVVLMGPPDGLREAAQQLNRQVEYEDPGPEARFELVPVAIAKSSPLSGKTLADLRFRQEYGVTVIGIRRGDEHITTVSPDERVQDGDHLMVIGTAPAVAGLKRLEPL